MDKKEIIKRLQGTIALDDLELTEYVPTGSYALNKVITGSYTGGAPIGGITQLRGDSSTGKTLFATSILKEAQKLGYYTKLLDTENAFNKAFAIKLGIEPEQLLYSNPETIEDTFNDIEKTIQSIREMDKDTPIVIVLDSLAVLPCKAELGEKPEEVDYSSNNYDLNPMDGARRALATGSCLRKINTLIRKNRVALIIINQLRTKVGVMYGDPTTNAAGGRSLEYYLAVDLRTKSNKTSDVLKDDHGNPIGIEGEVECKKNKCSIPFKTCKFKVIFNQGLDPYYGLLEDAVAAGIVEITGKGRYKMGDLKFTEKEFDAYLANDSDATGAIIKSKLNLK